jgi:hypothetical protein
MIREKLIEAGHRTITDKVYISLIAATAAQVGTLLIVMARYLFREPAASRLSAKSRRTAVIKEMAGGGERTPGKKTE